MKSFFSNLLATTLVLITTVLAANAQDRKALVVGINEYPELQNLTRAVADAEAMKASLEKWDFEVTLEVNTTEAEFVDALLRFAAEIQTGDDIVVFFSGHGISIDRENYLLMSDTPEISGVHRLKIERASVSVQLILEMIHAKGAASAILILDACRDNPYGGLIGGDIGLSAMSPADRSFVFTSAFEGQTALDRLTNDDPDPNSVFTRVLLEEIQNGSRSIVDIAKAVKHRVRSLAQAHGHLQVPDYIPRLATDFRFDTTPIQEDDITPPDNVAAACTGFATPLPLHNIGTDVVDITGQGQYISFGGAATVCVKDQSVEITSGQTRIIPCSDILTGEYDGLGHTFFSAGVPWRFWFYIPKEGSQKTLEMGLYEGLASTKELYWVQTGVPICNG